jgi:hypothetical protein
VISKILTHEILQCDIEDNPIVQSIAVTRRPINAGLFKLGRIVKLTTTGTMADRLEIIFRFKETSLHDPFNTLDYDDYHHHHHHHHHNHHHHHHPSEPSAIHSFPTNLGATSKF